MRNFVGQWYHVKQWQKYCTETLQKVFSNAKKMASRNIFRHFFRANFFMFALLISNHTVFLVQFEINLHLRVFQKAEIALLAKAARAISAFWKTHSYKLIPNWTRNRITYTNTVLIKVNSVFFQIIWFNFEPLNEGTSDSSNWLVEAGTRNPSRKQLCFVWKVVHTISVLFSD